MVIKSKSIAITGAAGNSVNDALAGLGEKKRRIKSLVFNPPAIASATAWSSYYVTKCVAYKDQEQVMEVSLGSFMQPITSATDAPFLDLVRRVELDLELDVGDGFKVGWYNTSAISGSVDMYYEDLE